MLPAHETRRKSTGTKMVMPQPESRLPVDCATAGGCCRMRIMQCSIRRALTTTGVYLLMGIGVWILWMMENSGPHVPGGGPPIAIMSTLALMMWSFPWFFMLIEAIVPDVLFDQAFAANHPYTVSFLSIFLLGIPNAFIVFCTTASYKTLQNISKSSVQLYGLVTLVVGLLASALYVLLSVFVRA